MYKYKNVEATPSRDECVDNFSKHFHLQQQTNRPQLDLTNIEEREDSHNRKVIIRSIYRDCKLENFPVYRNTDGSLNQIVQCLRSMHTRIDLLPPNEGYENYAEAVEAARGICDGMECFKGFNITDIPPWRTTVNNQQVEIEVVDWENYMKRIDSDRSVWCNEYIERKRKEYQNVLDLEEGCARMHITDTKVFYSYPEQKMWNAKADMEVRESDNWEVDLLKKIRPDVGQMRSLMYCGHVSGSLGRFLEATHDLNKLAKVEVGLFRHLKCIDDLQELYLSIETRKQRGYEMSTCTNVAELFIFEIAPQLQNLKVLSFAPGFTVLPGALVAIADNLPFLERLDISHAFSHVEGALELEQDVTDDKRHMYYEFSLPICVSRLKRLVRLDIGSIIDDFDYKDVLILSKRALTYIEGTLKSRGGGLTQSFQTLPPFWPSHFDEEQIMKVRSHSQNKIIHDPKVDPDLRNIAHLELRCALETANRKCKAITVDENFDDLSHSSNPEITVARNLSNKRRHEEEESPPVENLKHPRLP